jgi:ATP-dependent helicase/nuclease subunit A
LRRWIDAGRDGNAFDFYASVLGRDGARRAFANRLGAEAEDLIDIFEEQALEGSAGLPSLRQLITSLEIAAPEIKREVDTRRDEIRVITVHSAKGLEAPVVFLVDPGSPPVHHSHRPPVMRVDTGEARAPFLWRKGKGGDSAGLLEAEIGRWSRAQEAEYRRLLYVAMTRAADRLIVCGYYGKQKPTYPHWHARVREALTPDAQVVADANGDIREWVWTRPGERREKAPAKEAQDVGTATQRETTPAWLFENARRELAPPRPISPSQASLLIAGEQAGMATALSSEAEAFARQTRARQRGIAIHRLLQYLPDYLPAERKAIGEQWLARQFADWPHEEMNAVLGEALAILDNPRLAALFSPAARAEIRVGGTVRLGGRDIAVSGQIDRLVLTPGAVEFADFKSGLVSEAGVVAAERLQLALYGALLAQIHPDRALRGMLVRTRSGAVEMLDAAAIERELAAITWA